MKWPRSEPRAPSRRCRGPLGAKRANNPESVLLVAPPRESAGVLADDLSALNRWRPVRPRSPSFPMTTRAPGGAVDWAADGPPLVAPRTRWTRRCPPPPISFRRTGFCGAATGWDREAFLAHLLTHGYDRVDTVERAGEVAVRGEVLDLWSPGADGPSGPSGPSTKSNPSQNRPDHPALHRPGGRRARVSGPDRRGARRPSGLFGAERRPQFESRPARDRPLVWKAAAPSTTQASAPTTGSPPAARRRADGFVVPEIERWLTAGWTVSVFCHNAGEQERLEELLLLENRGLAAFEARRIDLPLGPWPGDFWTPATSRPCCPTGSFRPGPSTASFAQIRRRRGAPGGGRTPQRDYVVHERFGVSRYMALEHKNAGGVESDYLRLEYKGGDRVFVPLFEFRQVRKFIGTEGKRPVLSSSTPPPGTAPRPRWKPPWPKWPGNCWPAPPPPARAPGFAFRPTPHLEQGVQGVFLVTSRPTRPARSRKPNAT